MNAIALNPEQFIFAQDSELKTTSLKIAEAFEKRHADVLRTISNIASQVSESFNQRNFALVDYIDPKGEKRPAYELTKDGYVMVVMGFTGEKAMQIKEAYINAFNLMAAKLFPAYGLKQLPEPPTLSALPGKLTLEQQDVIKALVKERAEALPKEMQAGATIRCWSAIKKKFGCTYKEVDSANFVNIISLLSRLPLEGELLSKPEPADNAISIRMRDGGNLRLTFDQHAEEPQRYFVDAFQGNIYVKALGHDSFSVNIADLPKVLSEPGVVDLKYLPLIAEACIKRWNSASRR